jgi:hypothetical protein
MAHRYGQQPQQIVYHHYGSAPTRTSGLAIASLVLGIIWLYWIGSILAVIFGHVAISQMKKDPQIGGRGLAIAGLVLGYVGVATLALILVAGAAISTNT